MATLAEDIADKKEIITLIKASFSNQQSAGGLTRYTTQGTEVSYQKPTEAYALLRKVETELAELERQEALGLPYDSI